MPIFKEGIRRALRMDPDIILVGEMRDLETIHAAIEAAETGHVVFGTLHTNGASATVNRIIDVFPKDQQDQIRTQLSTALIGVLSQTLLPKKPEGVVAAYEMMVVTPAIPNLIRENKTYRIDSEHPDRPGKHGMFLLDDSLFRLWNNGIVRKGRSAAAVRKSQRSWPPKSPPPKPARTSRTRTRMTTRTRMKTTMTTTTTRMSARVASRRTSSGNVCPFRRLRLSVGFVSAACGLALVRPADALR